MIKIDTYAHVDALEQPIKIGDYVATPNMFNSFSFGIVHDFTPKGCRVKMLDGRTRTKNKIYYSQNIIRLSDDQIKTLFFKVLKS